MRCNLPLLNSFKRVLAPNSATTLPLPETFIIIAVNHMRVCSVKWKSISNKCLLINLYKTTTMNTLKYTIIKNNHQYNEYCDTLEHLILQGNHQDEIDLLTLLIEKWDEEQNTLIDVDPIELLKALMKEHNLKAKDLADKVELSKGTISKILNYHKGLSKDSIRKLSEIFKVSQSAFNRPYKLHTQESKSFYNQT